MPTGSLPAEGKKIWERVYDQAKSDGDSQEVAARKAWGAVKNAGWSKDSEGNWTKKAELQEFSLTIRKATLDPVSGEMRWRADTSDVDSDLYDDSMSMELFSDFIRRINQAEPAPEAVRSHYSSSYWDGGMPYLSLSHYYDLDGSAVPGVVDSLFVDGKFLKAKGRLYDNRLGQAVWASLKSDLEKKSEAHNPVRISIAFLDYKHQHKDSGFVFERSFDDPAKLVCPECRANAKDGKMGGKVFLQGLLIHLALTRVPVNQRTIMEVEKAMTTRREDAESIVGADLAAEIDTKSLEVGKADLDDAIVTRTDETPVETTVDHALPEILNALTMLSQAVTTLTEEVRAMKNGKGANGEAEDSPEDETEDEKEKKMKSDVEVLESQVIEAPVAFDPATLVTALSEAMGATNQKLDILIAAVSQKAIPANAVPERKSIAPSNVPQFIPGQSNQPVPGAPMKIGDIVRRSVGG